MAERALFALHKAIVCRLRSSPSTVTPWFASFSRDILLEVFNLIFKKVIQHNSFGHAYTESPAIIKVIFTDIFKRMNEDTFYIIITAGTY
jgi:hypothetical protein